MMAAAVHGQGQVGGLGRGAGSRGRGPSCQREPKPKTYRSGFLESSCLYPLRVVTVSFTRKRAP
jgi:hypothetical protein